MDTIHLPNAITLSTAFGAPGAPLPPVHVVQALVLGLIEGDVFRLKLPQAVVDVRSSVPLTPGSTITVATKGTGTSARLIIYSDDAQPAASVASAPADSANAAPASVAGKHPIGEAVVLGRAPSGATARIAAEPLAVAVAVADAPSIDPASPPPVAATPRNISPQQALGEAVSSAAARQSGLAPLFADVEQVVQAPPGAVPQPVRAAAAQILALRVPLDQHLTAADVKQAFMHSGVLLESKVAVESHAAPASPSLPGAPESTPSGDLKAALIVFREVLKVWSGATAPDPAAPASAPAHTEIARPALPDAAAIRHLASALAGATDELLPTMGPLLPEQATQLAKSVAAAALYGRAAPAEHAGGLPPPYRGAPLSAQPPASATIAPDTPPHETAERLLGATDGAIARTTLLQAASLSDQGGGAPRLDQGAPRWTFEVPFMTPQGTGVAQFEVSRDGGSAKPDDAPAATWRARFSLDLEPMGPVHAMIALCGEHASVTLWAERATTAAQLNEQAPLLNQALRAAELEPAEFQFRVGTPPVVVRHAAPGHFMDCAT